MLRRSIDRSVDAVWRSLSQNRLPAQATPVTPSSIGLARLLPELANQQQLALDGSRHTADAIGDLTGGAALEFQGGDLPQQGIVEPVEQRDGIQRALVALAECLICFRVLTS